MHDSSRLHFTAKDRILLRIFTWAASNLFDAEHSQANVAERACCTICSMDMAEAMLPTHSRDGKLSHSPGSHRAKELRLRFRFEDTASERAHR